jgi:hypothetical protein
MAKRSFKLSGWTPVGVLDTANYTDNGYQALIGGSTTQRINIIEVEIGGLASVTSPCPMILARDSTVEITPTALGAGQSDASFDPASAALAAPPIAFTASTTKPQRSATLGLLALAFNAFGGVVRWQAAPGEEIGLLGNTASFGEVSLSCYTGGTPGLVASHIIYEPL